MKVSIITVCYNSESTIESTIKSIVSQTYKDIEYIIVDGNSKDNTMNIIKNYEKYISKWISEPDNGIYDAFNKGIALANGDIIGIVNSDDYLENDSVEKIVNCFLELSDADLVHGNMRIVNENGKFLYINKGKKELLKTRFVSMPVCHPTVFVKKSVYDDIGLFDTNYRIAGDYDFILKCIDNKKVFYYIDEIISNMRVGGASDNYIKGFKEARKVKIKHGCSKEKANLFYSSSILKKSIGDKLNRNKIFIKLYAYYKNSK